VTSAEAADAEGMCFEDLLPLHRRCVMCSCFYCECLCVLVFVVFAKLVVIIIGLALFVHGKF